MTLWAVAHQAPLSVGFPRQQYWSGLPFSPPGDLPNPGIEPGSLALAGGFFTTWEGPASLPISKFPSELKFSSCSKVTILVVIITHHPPHQSPSFSSEAHHQLTYMAQCPCSQVWPSSSFLSVGCATARVGLKTSDLLPSWSLPFPPVGTSNDSIPSCK